MILTFALAAAVTPPPNLLLVTVDTLRADRLHAYGYSLVATPATDRLAREGVLIEEAVVHVPQTLPSHVSILTGLLPFEHGVRDNYAPALDARHTTLATHLRGRGYDTAAFIGSFVLSAPTGLSRGFDVYDDPFSSTEARARKGASERRAAAVVDAALAWLERPRTRPFFAWIHLYDPHLPYDAPEPYGGRYAGRPYDGEVAYADSQVGRILDFLDRDGLRGRTLLVVTSDHGEGLGDHGEEAHLLFVYDATLRVPLILSWPGVLPERVRVAGQFRSIDLAPTLLDLLGQPLAAQTRGASYASVLRAGGRIPDNESYAESLFGLLHLGYAPLRALRAEGWKLVDAPRPELYALREDPGEVKDVVAVRPQVAERMRERLGRYEGGTPEAVAAPDAAALERLAALGYLGGAAPARRPGSAAGPDPKDRIGEFQRLTKTTQQALTLYNDGDLDGAISLLAPLAKGDPVSLEVEYFLGKSLLLRKRPAEAARALERALSLSPRWTQAYLDLAAAEFERGQVRRALQVMDQALELEPVNALVLREKGILMSRAGDAAGARPVLERARGLAPADTRLRLALSAAYRDLGDTRRAVEELKEAVSRDPGFGDGLNALGVLFAASDDLTAAAGAFEGALRADPRDPDALFGLAEVRLRQGRAAEAATLAETLLATSPRFPGAAALLERARRASEPGTLWLRILRVKDRGKAEEALRRAKAGESFGALARELSADPTASRGGDLGAVRVADLAAPLRSAAETLAPGALSPVLVAGSDYVVLKRER